MKRGPKPKPTATRILVAVEVSESGCWVWQRRLDRDGYGQFDRSSRPTRTTRVHRVAYETFVGPVPAGRVIDHLCRVRACCNPDHLEPVTRAENINRGVGFGRPGVPRSEVLRGAA